MLTKLRCLSRNQIKLIAMLSMLIDHCAVAFVAKETIWYVLMRWVIGRIAFPLFAVLFIDGFFRTKHPWRHVLDLGIFAILSEPGYDRVLAKSWFTLKSQSVMLAWMLCFLMMIVLHRLYLMYQSGTLDQTFWFFGSVILIILFAVAGELLGVDYAWCGPLAIGVGLMVYYYKPSLIWVAVAVCACLTCASMKPGIMLAVPIIWCYDPMKECKRNKWMKYSFYAFYPVHLAVLGLLMELVKRIPLA